MLILAQLPSCWWLMVGARVSRKRVPRQGHQYCRKDTPIGGDVGSDRLV
ncbi:hypothetical protein MC7420_5016 [Coleofasciculus chthonoplastes PCC 7420]|uniref:Uncharacterized protein n=1 Tax=Coleofasciculus chthonoplastes PCC 7420 TaxID=118168 RepID=B4VZE1_9CYAN|nr:hypothetical protein MC7420_5016 [Coleofasciculus chthonoplastes PCC 7420]